MTLPQQEEAQVPVPSYVQLHDENVRLTREVEKLCAAQRLFADEASRWRSESARLHDELARREQNNIVRQNNELRHDLTEIDKKFREASASAIDWHKKFMAEKTEVKRLRGEVDRLAHEAQEHFEALAAIPSETRVSAGELAVLNSERVQAAREKIESDQRHALDDARRFDEQHRFLLRKAMSENEHFRLRNKRLHDRVLELVRENRRLFALLGPPTLRAIADGKPDLRPVPGGCVVTDEPMLGEHPVSSYRLPDANQEGHE